jgi:hypothetical protein
MPKGTVIDDVRARVDSRLAELEPYVKEYDELRRVASALRGEPTEPDNGRPAPRRRLRSTGPGRAGHSARADEATRLIAAQPGIEVKVLAEKMGIGPTYLYRLLPRLEREGVLRKEGKGYFLAAAK